MVKKTEVLQRSLLIIPSGICTNCLNRAHDICDRETCACRLREHDDSAWWVPTDAAVKILDVVALLDRLGSAAHDTAPTSYHKALYDVRSQLSALNWRLFVGLTRAKRNARKPCPDCRGRGRFAGDMMASYWIPCGRCGGSGRVAVPSRPRAPRAKTPRHPGPAKRPRGYATLQDAARSKKTRARGKKR